MVDSLFDIRQSDLKVTNINDNLTCKQGLNVCCKKKSTPTITSTSEELQKPPKDVVSDKCEDFANDGFKCVEKFRCLDDAFG